jgi:hypothetical protein
MEVGISRLYGPWLHFALAAPPAGCLHAGTPARRPQLTPTSHLLACMRSTPHCMHGGSLCVGQPRCRLMGFLLLAAVLADPDWIAAKAASEPDGGLVSKVENHFGS